MNKIKTIKIKNEDGSISEESYTIAADALNIDMVNGKNVQETIGTIDVDKDGDIATQLNKKINKSDIIDNLDSADNNKVLSAKQGKVLNEAVAAANLDIKKKIYYFNTVADMKKDEDLVAGDTCQLLTNEGDAELYKIINNNLSEYVDNYNYVEIVENELYAVRIEQKRDKNIEKLQKNLNIHSLKNELVNYPLLVIKKFIGGTTGSEMSAQGMTAKYKDDGTLDYIYLFGDYGTFGRLYIVKCGNMTTGLDWEYTYTDNVPNVHGSCLSYKDRYIYIGDNPNSANGVFTKYDIENDNYELIDISNVVPYLITGIVWDNETNTFLVNANNNNNLYILDENYNLIREYTHNYVGHINYVMQGYEYKNGLEYRAVSNGNVGYIFVFDTTNGNLLKTINVGYVNGEIEDISINNGFALLYFNNFCNGYNGIYMHAVTLTYIGGDTKNNVFSLLQQNYFINDYFSSIGGKSLQNGNTLYYQNNNSNNDIIRYCGTGSSSNPIKSGLALSYILASLSNIASDFYTTLNILASSNTDDNGLRIVGKNNMDRLIIQGNNNSLNELYLENIDTFINNINCIAGNSRRDTGIMTLLRCKIEVHGTNTCLKYDIQNSSLILTDNGINATSSTLQSMLRRNIIINNPSKLTATYINRYDNLGDTT